MAYNRSLNDVARREQRQQSYLAAPTLGSRHAGVAEVAIELHFTAGGGKPYCSPYRQVFARDMQAFFAIQCPDRACQNGGFDMNGSVAKAVAAGTESSTGSLTCAGRSARADAEGGRCGLQLDYRIAVVRA